MDEPDISYWNFKDAELPAEVSGKAVISCFTRSYNMGTHVAFGTHVASGVTDNALPITDAVTFVTIGPRGTGKSNIAATLSPV
jgi:hypothetical protein